MYIVFLKYFNCQRSFLIIKLRLNRSIEDLTDNTIITMPTRLLIVSNEPFLFWGIKEHSTSRTKSLDTVYICLPWTERHFCFFRVVLTAVVENRVWLIAAWWILRVAVSNTTFLKFTKLLTGNWVKQDLIQDDYRENESITKHLMINRKSFVFTQLRKWSVLISNLIEWITTDRVIVQYMVIMTHEYNIHHYKKLPEHYLSGIFCNQ